MEQKTNKKFLILLTVIITTAIIAITETILYFSLRKTMTLVLYDTESIQEETTSGYSKENVCAYIRLNSDKNHTLNVKDFYILHDGKYIAAYKVEYFKQTITTTFETYPNQPLLTVYFDVPHSANESVAYIKYKNTEMRIGEFALE